MAAREVRPRLTDQEIAELIERDMQFDGQTFRLGQYVGILDGRVVLVAETAEEALAAFQDLEPDRSRGLLCIAAPAEPDVIR